MLARAPSLRHPQVGAPDRQAGLERSGVSGDKCDLSAGRQEPTGEQLVSDCQAARPVDGGCRGCNCSGCNRCVVLDSADTSASGQPTGFSLGTK